MNKIYQNLLDDIISVKPSEALLSEITQDLMTEGFYCLDGALDKKTLTEFKCEIESLIDEKGRRYFSLINPYKNIKSKFNLLDKSKNLKGFLFELAKLGSKNKYSKSEILNVLRVVAGGKTNSQSLKFHYDATIITILIPLVIPKGSPEECGHFLAFKNLRRLRNNVLLNFLEKILMQNIFTQKIISLIALKNISKHIIEFKEGNIYFFYGYRTLHANLPLKSEYTRATMLFHYGDPHQDSLLLKSIAKIRHFRENINSKK